MTNLLEAVGAKVGFYKLPTDLTPEDIDSLIRKAVFRINESGWLWTAESCQGHPDSTEPAWAANTDPMIRFAVPKAQSGRFFNALATATKVIEERTYVVPLLKIVIAVDRGAWWELLVYLPASTAYERNLGITAFEVFAELVNQQTHEAVA